MREEENLVKYVIQVKKNINTIVPKLKHLGILNQEKFNKWQDILNGILRELRKKVINNEQIKLLIDEVKKIDFLSQPQNEVKPEDIVNICNSIIVKLNKNKKVA